VTAQDPAANAQAAPGSTVKLTVVTGKPLVLVPTIVGLTEQAAIVLLTQSSLAPGTRTEAFDPAVPAGSIVSQQPPAGVSVAAQTDRKSTRLNSSHLGISYAVFCLKKTK